MGIRSSIADYLQSIASDGTVLGTFPVGSSDSRRGGSILGATRGERPHFDGRRPKWTKQRFSPQYARSFPSIIGTRSLTNHRASSRVGAVSLCPVAHAAENGFRPSSSSSSI